MFGTAPPLAWSDVGHGPAPSHMCSDHAAHDVHRLSLAIRGKLGTLHNVKGVHANSGAVLLALIVATLGISPQRTFSTVLAASQQACSLPSKLNVPGGTPSALALDSAARLLIVATPAGLDLLDSCTGKLKAQENAGARDAA